jgi:hypothetical protein
LTALEARGSVETLIALEARGSVEALTALEARGSVEALIVLWLGACPCSFCRFFPLGSGISVYGTQHNQYVLESDFVLRYQELF